MAQQIINNGNFLDDPNAETVYQAFSKTKLNFAELYELVKNQGYKTYRLDLNGINTDQAEPAYIAAAINRGRKVAGVFGNPFESAIGQKILFFTTTGQVEIRDSGGGQSNTQAKYRFYRVHPKGQSFGGSAQSVTGAQVSPAGSYVLNEATDSDSFIDLGNIGGADIQAAFNLGNEFGDAWVVSGLTIVKAIQNGVLRAWNFNGGDGAWGGNDVTNPNYMFARDFNFDLISDQPIVSADSSITKVSRRYIPIEIPTATARLLPLSSESTTFEVSLTALDGDGTISGFSGNIDPIIYDGADIYIKNATGNNLTLKHDNAGDAKFFFKDEADLTLKKGDIAHFKYNTRTNKVELVGGSGGGIDFVTDNSLYYDTSTKELRSNTGQVTERFEYALGGEFVLVDKPSRIIYIAVNGQLLMNELTQWNVDVASKKVTILETLDPTDIININYQFIITE